MKFKIKPHIVQFENDQYAIRRFSFNPVHFGYVYRDLTDNFWWSAGGPYMSYCVTPDLDKIKNMFDTMNPKVKEVL